jgi:hypothetical protein
MAEQQYWFRTMKFGWGWSPATWQAWLITIIFVVVVTGGSIYFTGQNNMPMYYGFLAVMVVLYLVIAWAKGAPPHWQWGNDKPE